MSYTHEELSKVAEAVERLGSQRKAAAELGLSRRALQRRLYAFNNEFHDDDNLVDREAAEVGFDASSVNHYWVKTDKGSYHVKNDVPINYNELRERFLEDAANYAVSYPANDYEPYLSALKDKHLLIIDIADAHFGKLAVKEETGGDYNLDIAAARMREGVKSLTLKAEAHGVEKIVFVLGNDILHIDTPFRKTTSGTPQDTDGQFWQAFQLAKRCYIAAIEELAAVAPVHLVFNPSNHDYASGWMLADSVSSWFSKHPNVYTQDGSLSISHRKYIQYGSNLIGFTHGDGAKETDLPSLMQYEARSAWGNSRYAYWYTHHLHVKDRKAYGTHKHNFRIERDHIGVTVLHAGNQIDPENNVFVEIVRSPSEADGWHDRNGYKGNAAIECFMHHVDRGQVARFTHYF